jgi:hypothetical protein
MRRIAPIVSAAGMGNRTSRADGEGGARRLIDEWSGGVGLPPPCR